GTELDAIIDLLNYQESVSIIIGPNGQTPLTSAATSGDFNKDGCDDIVIYTGNTYIVFGKPVFPDSTFLGNPDSSITTILFGASARMLSCGDYNGDTFDDLIIGAPSYFPKSQVYVLYGRESFPDSINLDVRQDFLTRIMEPFDYQNTGRGLDCEDVNNDGFDDLLIGSPGAGSGFGLDRVYLLFGSSLPSDTVLLSDESLGIKIFYGEYSYGNLGYRVAFGDVNNDMAKDLIFTAYTAEPLGCDQCGQIYVVFWNESLPDTIDLSSDAFPITRILGKGTVQSYGLRLVVEDIDGDDYDDIIFSSHRDDYELDDVGKVTIVYGSLSLPDTVFLESDTLVSVFLGEYRSDSFGIGLGSCDFNNDGIEDLLIGAKTASPLGRTYAGIARLFYGIRTSSGTPRNVFPQITLMQNFPNPFSASTSIEYSLIKPTKATLTIYNICGHLVAQMVEPNASEDLNAFIWKGLDNKGEKVASGLYFYRLEAGGFTSTKKMVLLR
ncbi:FG-GAP repeat protein, partial [Candidatus Pacearchaeota archaeon]|nr:FG-GAP repeat protein [Candidatus Pacearchaeota archaeon]